MLDIVTRWLSISGGEGSRTPVLNAFHISVYMDSRAFTDLGIVRPYPARLTIR